MSTSLNLLKTMDPKIYLLSAECQKATWRCQTLIFKRQANWFPLSVIIMSKRPASVSEEEQLTAKRATGSRKRDTGLDTWICHTLCRSIVSIPGFRNLSTSLRFNVKQMATGINTGILMFH